MESRRDPVELLCTVANYGFSSQADHLKEQLGQHFETLLLDNDSPQKPRLVDHALPNLYYPGLWNSAVELAASKKRKWLLFVASDVQIDDVDRVAERIKLAIRVRRLGIYTPALRVGSRLSFPACFSRRTQGVRECYACEGFFFLARTEILSRLHPIDVQRNRYGWGVDLLACYHAYLRGLRVVVDDCVEIFHPAAVHEIPVEAAREQCKNSVDPRVWRFLAWAEARLAASDHGTLSPGLRFELGRWKWRVNEIVHRIRLGAAQRPVLT